MTQILSKNELYQYRIIDAILVYEVIDENHFYYDIKVVKVIGNKKEAYIPDMLHKHSFAVQNSRPYVDLEKELDNV